jgi:hypothetical protein
MFINLPCKIPYNAKWITLVLAVVMFGGCAWFFADKAIHNDRGLILDLIPMDTGGATIAYWVFAAASAVFVVLAVATSIYRVTNPRLLELDEDGITIPGGFFKPEPSRILFSELIGLSEQKVSRQRFLYMTTKKRRYTLNAALLPDKETYDAITQLLGSQLRNAGGR